MELLSIYNQLTVINFKNFIKNKKLEMTVFDFAIAYGSYDIALSLKKLGEKPKSIEFYEDYNKLKKIPYFNYKILLEHLENEIQSEFCLPFHIKLPESSLMSNFIFMINNKLEIILNDPVIDPRESWSDMFKRILEFQDPPLVLY